MNANSQPAEEFPSLETMPVGDWRDYALCSQTDPEAFFPEKGGSLEQARKICNACDVRDSCLAWALENGEDQGVWGGLSSRERRALQRVSATARRRETLTDDVQRSLPRDSRTNWSSAKQVAS